MSDPVPVSSKPAGEGDDGAPAKEAAAPVKANAVSIKMAGVIRPYLDKATPVVVFFGNVLSVIEPYLVALWAYLQYVWEKLQPYHPEDLFPALAGFGAFESPLPPRDADRASARPTTSATRIATRRASRLAPLTRASRHAPTTRGLVSRR